MGTSHLTKTTETDGGWWVSVYFLWGVAFILGEVCVWLRLSYVLRWPTHTQRPGTLGGIIPSQGAFSWEATTKYLVYISKSHELVGGISKPALLTQFLHPEDFPIWGTPGGLLGDFPICGTSGGLLGDFPICGTSGGLPNLWDFPICGTSVGPCICRPM